MPKGAPAEASSSSDDDAALSCGAVDGSFANMGDSVEAASLGARPVEPLPTAEDARPRPRDALSLRTARAVAKFPLRFCEALI